MLEFKNRITWCVKITASDHEGQQWGVLRNIMLLQWPCHEIVTVETFAYHVVELTRKLFVRFTMDMFGIFPVKSG